MMKTADKLENPLILLNKYDRNIPRYTSYPTATHFNQNVNEVIYRRWLSRCKKDKNFSLYFHIPFCQKLCWFCGCNTKIVNRYERVQSYVELLEKELEFVTKILQKKLHVQHIHFGGGSPNILLEKDFSRLMSLLRKKFEIAKQTVVAFLFLF